MSDKRRVGRVSQEILKAVNDILAKDIRDPRVQAVTLTEVDLTGDLQQATIYYTSHDDSEEGKKDLREGLEQASGKIRAEVGNYLTTYHTPEIIFSRDESIETGNRIDELLREINEDEHN